MKKNLLALLSWAVVLFGAVSFSSCGDDDDDDKSNNSSSAASIFEKYSSQQGGKIDGDNVVYVLGNTITVYTYSGETLTKATCYMNCGSEATAKKMAEEYGAKSDGIYMYYELDDEDLADYKGLSKEEVAKGLDFEF